jgi:asparagine synthase (glutamine-hydrolysing)
MTGIVGVVHRDGSAVPEGRVRRMAEATRAGAADRRGWWAEGPVGLGGAAFHTTPEAPAEGLPVRAGPFALAADVRLDNRVDLLTRLGSVLDGLGLRRTGRPVSDADLLLAAYAEWGADCPARLLGDYAFAAWDARGRTLFCACSPFGVRPLYVSHDPARLAVATEPRALFAAGVPREIDDDLARELSRTGMSPSPDRTIFRHVRLLPAGHAVEVSPDGVLEWPHYTLRPSPGPVPQRDEAVAERFAELFAEAVRCRLRGGAVAGAQLSGGLDSSAVAVVARDVLAERGALPLDTFTLAFEATPRVDERPFAEAVLATGGFRPHTVVADGLGPLSNLADVYAAVDDGPAVGTQHLVWALCKAAGEAGVRVLLDGIDGDLVVEHGQNRLHELAREGDWETFFREARLLVERHRGVDRLHSFERDFAGTPGSLFSGYGLPALDALAATGPPWAFARSLRGAVRHGNARPRAVLRRVWRRLLVPAPLLRRTGRAGGGRSRTVRGDQLEGLQNPKLARGLALATHAAAAHGVELAHPFLDVRLVEFCLALPSAQSLQNGWTRSVLRRALADDLPPLVRDRVGKTSMSPAFDRGLFEVDRALLDRLVDRAGRAPTVDASGLAEARDRLAAAHREGGHAGGQAGLLAARASVVAWLDALGYGKT